MDESGLVAPASDDTKPGCWLLFFGILELLIGALAALLDVIILALFLFAERLPSFRSGFHPQFMVFSACFYGAAALCFLAAGVGTLRRRRWARTLMLVVSTFWLGTGILICLILVLLWPVLSRSFPQASAGSAMFVLAFTSGLIGVLYVLLPGSFLFFYTRRSVRDSFVRAAPEVESGPHRPLAVIVLCVWMLLGVAGAAFGMLLNRQALFGVVFTGLAAFAVSLLVFAAQACLVRGVWGLRPWAWWGSLTYYALAAVSGLITFMRVPLSTLMEGLGTGPMGAEQREMMPWMQTYMPVLAGIGQLLFLSLMVYVKRYFPARTAAGAAVTE